jgi:hypothetical protein
MKFLWFSSVSPRKWWDILIGHNLLFSTSFLINHSVTLPLTYTLHKALLRNHETILGDLALSSSHSGSGHELVNSQKEAEHKIM